MIKVNMEVKHPRLILKRFFFKLALFLIELNCLICILGKKFLKNIVRYIISGKCSKLLWKSAGITHIKIYLKTA